MDQHSASRQQMEEKLKNFTEIEFPQVDGVSQHAKHFI